MKRIALLLFFAAAPVLPAQNPADTGRAGRMRQHREEFQRQREARLREALRLTDDQAAKLKATQQRFGDQRRAIMERQHQLGEALRGQLQPGVAANADSLRKLLDAQEQNEAALAQLRRDQNREMAGYLSPLQRARLSLMRQHFARMGRGRGAGPGEGGPWRDGPWWGRHRPRFRSG